MKLELKTKWVEALRSGVYDQTTSVLRNGGSFCCIGVLCDVANPDGWQKNDWAYDDYTCENELPASICLALGLTNAQQQTLISMNDDQGSNFLAIAEWIDSHVPAVGKPDDSRG